MQPDKVKRAKLIIYRSENGRDGWEPVGPDELPDWVKHPDNMARMVAGHECMNAAEGEKGSAWYRAVPVADLRRMAATQEKRERRAAKKRVLH